MHTINKDDLGWVADGRVHTVEFGNYTIRYYENDGRLSGGHAFFNGGLDVNGQNLNVVGETDDERKADAIEKAYWVLKNQLRTFWTKAARLGVRIDD